MTGIKHIEFWVSDLNKSLDFYKEFFKLINWEVVNDHEFGRDGIEIYFVEKGVGLQDAIGPRHICFHADSREVVESVAALLKRRNMSIIRGPVEMPYSPGYYTVDFKDPDGYILEVAHRP